jgi:hypothetical protein
VATNLKEQIEVTVRDILGRVYQQMKLETYQTVVFGDDWEKGIYMLEIKQGNQYKTMKMIKQ